MWINGYLNQIGQSIFDINVTFWRISRFYVMETLKDWYRGGDPNQKVPKLLVGLFGGNQARLKCWKFIGWCMAFTRIKSIEKRTSCLQMDVLCDESMTCLFETQEILTNPVRPIEDCKVPPTKLKLRISIWNIQTSICLGIAGATSVLGNTPLDVIKTRMQSLDAAKYKNTLDCAQ